ncbi:MAG: secretin N-terminal domain-containing protein, partial [Pseudomonadota bacterium]|nr:secretin N-terminal domain-containing protein [Pseudomonadota bacterium]
GPPHLVTQAVEVVKVLDQPLMQGQYSLRIEPAFLSASALAQRLTEVLHNQGYAVNKGSIHLLPIDETNALIAFARDAQVLALIRQWSQQLDQFNPQQRDKMSLFFYGVQNTAAEPLANTLNPLLNSILQSDTAQEAPPQSKAAKTPATVAIQKTTLTAAAPAQLAVDEHRNALIFSGTGEQWAQLLPVLKEMDQPAKQVLIEATIAEITLDETERRGIEWVINKADLGGLEGQLSTLGLGVGSQGLTYTLSNAGQVRAVLNAFASSKRATILQTPRLLVRSGSSASINVGNEIPTLTSQSVSDIQQGGSSALLQQIQYRSTGVALNITPVVYAGRRIDLTISQQLSESQDTAGGNVSAPVILNRQIDTELTLSDGHSVLLGGMISNNQTDGWNGIPFLSDLPILGQLFRVDNTTNVRTELVVMIIPYIIDDENEATAITEAVKQQLELLPTAKPSAH